MISADPTLDLVAKLRAKAWAAERRQPVQYAIAKDRISSVALREKPDQEKLSWLQRHDQDCGALYGVLPLCVGMPITAADHLDRGRGILRGCAGGGPGGCGHPTLQKRRRQKTVVFGTSCRHAFWFGFKRKKVGAASTGYRKTTCFQ